jgi:myo-inositol-1(or 4)-monophosphatase
MDARQLEEAARIAEVAADAARAEILPRFRSVAVETKRDGTPVTEADRSAERAIREILSGAFPDFGILGEELGEERAEGAPPSVGAPVWVVDPIDGTIAFSRGIPLFATLIALVENEEPVLGLIDCPTLDERYVGWKRGGCLRNGVATRVSDETDLSRAIVSHGDPFCFDRFGMRAGFERMAREIPMLRGYTDGFGHAQVLGGGIGAMVDLDLNPWDAAAARILVPEAGGRCAELAGPTGRIGLVLGSPALVDQLLALLS